MKAIGTDGEKTLVDAALRNFPQAAHVRCFRHLKQKTEMHLRVNNHFPEKPITEYNNDIFGWTETCGLYYEGLVDSTDGTTFDASLFSLKGKWDDMEIDAFGQHKVHTSFLPMVFEVQGRGIPSLYIVISKRRDRFRVTT